MFTIGRIQHECLVQRNCNLIESTIISDKINEIQFVLIHVGREHVKFSKNLSRISLNLKFVIKYAEIFIILKNLVLTCCVLFFVNLNIFIFTIHCNWKYFLLIFRLISTSFTKTTLFFRNSQMPIKECREFLLQTVYFMSIHKNIRTLNNPQMSHVSKM